jgi:hypothetical protein
MRFWRRDPKGEIEGRLRDERPQPSDHLVRAVEERIARRFAGSRIGRLVFAVVLTLGLVASLAGFGGLSYAASTASSSASSAVKLAKVSVGMQKAMPSAAKAIKKGDAKKKQKGDDDKKKKPKCNKGDDSDDPARDQYEDDDDRDDCD